MDIHECINLIYDKLIEYIDSIIYNIKTELTEYIDKVMFQKNEYINELFINYKLNIDKYIKNILLKENIKKFPDYIIGHNNINTNIKTYIPADTDTRYKINNNIYIPKIEIINLSNTIDIYNEYYDDKINNIYKDNIDKIILLDDPDEYIKILQSYLDNKSVNLICNMKNLML
ncbi:unknown similar to AMEV245 [Adoxophyes honmai entomopoxvirus 'L']|uniref:Uncharacterized protein n=1 Tax=Adoxophyes honmai entomopoxvirus 'L' TaxID=1293540 RepID=A0A916P6C6_9POXV|nr:unknown similar to AMEV245 [Adoxophyes honmai entomopoxvirus 'L']CCU55545.1 unknown similar to AMEV245 [Adoxophyes honmai entomopoxvirus 'L']